MKHIKAIIQHIGDPDPFEALHLTIPSDHIVNLTTFGELDSTITIHKPTDRDLASIIAACQGELDRRREAAVVEQPVQYHEAPCCQNGWRNTSWTDGPYRCGCWCHLPARRAPVAAEVQ